MLIFLFGSAGCKQAILKKLMKHSKTLLTIYISVLLLIMYSNLLIISADSSLFSHFLALSCSSLFSCRAPFMTDWLSCFFTYFFHALQVLRKITINLCEKDIFKKPSIKLSTVLNEYIFSYKWSIIQFYYLNHFLSHEF